MTKNEICPCMSECNYADCCEPAHSGQRWPETAEILMRSRYSAYVLGLANYIVKTTHPKFRSTDFRSEIQNWMNASSWTHLDILETSLGSENDDSGEVEFIAEFQYDGQSHILHERSKFLRYKGRWVYTEGKLFSE